MAIEPTKDSIVIPNAKQVAKKSATLWTGYVTLAILLVDWGVKLLQSDASVGLSDQHRMWLLTAAVPIGMVLRFWQQNIPKTDEGADDGR
jgi:hypothetical protein